jgi:hypothetical protein
MSAAICVPVLTSTGDVWYDGTRAGDVTRVPDTRYWSAHPAQTGERVRFNSRKAAIAYLVDRVKLEREGLRPDHYRHFGTSKTTGSLAPLSKEYDTYEEAAGDGRPPRAIFACKNVWVDGNPRILAHHWGQGPVTYEGKPGFRPIPQGAIVEPRAR